MQEIYDTTNNGGVKPVDLNSETNPVLQEGKESASTRYCMQGQDLEDTGDVASEEYEEPTQESTVEYDPTKKYKTNWNKISEMSDFAQLVNLLGETFGL